MNRLERISAILIQLQTKKLIKAQELADKFSISLRTVYRDIRALEEAGVPVIGEAGSGYKLMEGYKLPPVMFNQNEASALLTASKFMQAMTKGPLFSHYNTALDKIKAVLRWSEKEHIEGIDEQIAIVGHPSMINQKPLEIHLPKILHAIASHSMVQITYHSIEKAETNKRKIEPVGIYFQGNHWYLVAYCHLRNDYRNFRTDKIICLDVIEEKWTKIHPPLQNFLCRLTEKREVQKVVIEIKREIVRYLGDQKYYNGYVGEEEKGDVIRMTFLTGSLKGFAHWYLLFGEFAEIIEPECLIEDVRLLAEKLLKKLDKREMLLT